MAIVEILVNPEKHIQEQKLPTIPLPKDNSPANVLVIPFLHILFNTGPFVAGSHTCAILWPAFLTDITV
jgi:hypothetical protein